MKAKYVILLIIIITSLHFNNLPYKIIEYQFHENSSLYESHFKRNSGKNQLFLIGILDNFHSYETGYFDTLKLNLWHKYNSDIKINNIRFPSGLFEGDDPLNSGVNINSRISNALSKFKGKEIFGWAQRPRLELLCYGQSSIYQCEKLELNNNEWFYSFGVNNTGKYFKEDNVEGIFCSKKNGDKNGIVAAKLKANNEQCTENNDENSWMDDSQTRWHLKPRIKIESRFANNKNNYGIPVCSISVIKSNGDLLKSFILRTENFLVENDYYNGKFIEEYRIFNEKDSLIIDGAFGNSGPWSSRGNDTTDAVIPGVCKTDIKIYWYGNCDMWIDYIKVENDISNNLFKGVYDKWIKEESEIAFENNIIKFYTELFKYNNIPCIAYVNKKLKQNLSNADVINDFNWAYYTAHLPWSLAIHGKWSDNSYFDDNNIIKNYIYKAGITEFLIETYPFTASNSFPPLENFSKIPNTLDKISGEGILATPVEPDEYDNWLQNQLEFGEYPNSPDKDVFFQWKDPGNFIWNLKLANSISRNSGINWVSLTQSHLWWKLQNEVRREPTNEELELLANLAISFGTKGLVYFYWNGFGEINHVNNYGRGFCEDYGNTPRYLNVYNQPKWDKFKVMFSYISAIGTTLSEFDNRRTISFSFHKTSERKLLFELSPFTNIRSFRENNINNSVVTVFDPDSLTYVQAATFCKKGSETSDHFMIINRRCSPVFENNTGGGRNIIIDLDINNRLFKSGEIFTIVNIFDNSVAAIIKKGKESQINLGFFKPGEGKIFKIINGNVK